MTQSILQAQPFELSFDPCITAPVMIDMQRDFAETGSFGETLGNDVSLVCTTIAPYTGMLAAARQKGIMVIHTHEGRRADLSDCPPVRLTRGGKTFIGEPGPMGRILVRGEADHDIIPELYPVAGEPVTDKSGEDTFYRADLYLILQNHGIKTLIACGVTTEVCVTITVRETNDRGYKCVIPEDCVDSYLPEFWKYIPEMIKARDAISGRVVDSKAIIVGLEG